MASSRCSPCRSVAFTVSLTLFIILTLTTMESSGTATRCIKVEHSAYHSIDNVRVDLRINKCELRPSPYSIMSDVVMDASTEPEFRFHPSATCCCRVTEYREHSLPVGKTVFRYKEVERCECVQCSPEKFHRELLSLSSYYEK